MKANQRLRPAAVIVLSALAAMSSACSEPRTAPAPAPAPEQSPPPPRPAPVPDVNWRQAPITPGTWNWGMIGGQSVARFANGLLVLSCDRQAGTVTLLRAGAATGTVPMTISTSDLTRPLTAAARPGPPAAIEVAIPARDPLLDAMAFSRGRFAVEAAGLPTLYVPSWPEVSRVIEDCR